MSRHPHLTHAALGAVAWIPASLLVSPSWTATLLLLGPFVIVPLGLSVIGRHARSEHAQPGRLLVPAALTAATAFIPEPGLLAGALTLPWLAVTATVGAVGLLRAGGRRVADPLIGTDAGMAFLAVGGVWLTVSRLGANPLGFSDAIVQLTAVHFHYAGFALPIVAGVVARRRDAGAGLPWAVIAGVPVTAAGITFGGTLEWFGATVMALAGAGVAVSMLRVAAIERRLDLGAAGAALLGGMTLAWWWAWSIQFGWTLLTLDRMAAIHGSLNALGFGLLGLVALARVPTRGPAGVEAGVHLTLGRPRPATLDRVRLAAHRTSSDWSAVPEAGREPLGHRRDTFVVELDDLDGARAALRGWFGHRGAGIHLAPNTDDVELGQTVALAVPVGPVAVTAAARIVQVFDEPERFGFAYAALPHHFSDGVESFTAERRPDGRATLTVTAVWRPAVLATAIAPPITRFLQRRMIRRWLTAVATNRPVPT